MSDWVLEEQLANGTWVRASDSQFGYAHRWRRGSLIQPLYRSQQQTAALLDLRRRVGRSERAPVALDVQGITRQIEKALPLSARRKARKITVEVRLA